MSDSDDLFDEDLPLRRKKKVGGKKRKAMISDDDDDFEDDVPLASLKAMAKKAKVKVAAPAPKPKKRPAPPAADSSDSDDDVPINMLKARPPVVPVVHKIKKVKVERPVSSAERKPKPSSSKPKKKKAKSSSQPKKKKVKKSKGGVIVDARVKEVKRKTPVQLLDGARQAFKWWEVAPHKKKRDALGKLYVPKWSTLEHAGVYFSEAYAPHGVKMLYDGAAVDLAPAQEEVATFYAACLGAQQLQAATSAKIFNTNFMREFKKVLGKGHTVKDFKKCNFQPIRDHLDRQRDLKKEAPKAVKTALALGRQHLMAAHGYGIVDGRVEKVGNYTVEPPGLFRGRGEHPKMGSLKTRVPPEAITINTGCAQPVPRCAMPGHAWKRVDHRDDITWLAYWHENVQHATKYVYLHASSGFKGQSDLKKYEKARKLKDYIEKIRRDYGKNLKSKVVLKKQIATAMWVIDVLALRVGGEKNDDEADTVGCCSLRVEHFTFEDESNAIVLDFLGKDSMRYYETIDFEKYGDVGTLVYANFKAFCKKKSGTSDVFDQLTPSILNEHLSSLMPGLSAKVFRTYNASITLQKLLPRGVDPYTPPAEQVRLYNTANREVSILCNHQRSVPKGFEASFGKMQGKLELIEKQLKQLKKMLKRVKAGEEIPVKANQDGMDVEEKRKQSHLFTRQVPKEKIVKRIRDWEKKVATLRQQVRDKDENKAVSLTTAKINYMDPRITVAWCKQNEVMIEKVFATTLRDKFPWAMGVKTDWEF